MSIYREVEKPKLTARDYDVIEAASGAPAGLCGRTRPETLGYQRCWREKHHKGAHISQDAKAWIDLPVA